jgi:hypothetical protein
MPKIKKPATVTPAPETPTTETPKVDMSPLISQITEGLKAIDEAEGAKNEAVLNTIVEIRAFREENPTAERTDIRLAIQTAVAEQTGLKLAQVQTKPTKDERISKEVRSQRDSAYVLVSTLLSMAWAKEEKQDEKVAKLLASGEKRFVVIRDASRKPQSRPQHDPNAGKVTRENFTEELGKFLTKAYADLGGNGVATWETVFELARNGIDANETAVLNVPAAA